MIKTQKIFAGLLVMTGLAFAQTPTVTSVANAASYDTKLAPGSYFVAYGANMGPASISINSLPYATTAGGTAVKFTPVSGGTNLDAFMYYSVAGQIAGIIPSAAVPGDYNVTVSYNGQTSAAFKVTVLAHNVGIFTAAQSGAGPAILQNYNSGSDQPVNGFVSATVGGVSFAPAVAGKTVALILWGTGLGASPTPDDRGSNTANDLRGPNLTASVLVGGTEYPVDLYAGRSPQFPGIDQINLTLPAGITQGCTVSLQVKVNGQLSNMTSLSIAPSGQTACSHPILSEAVLTRLTNGGTATAGIFSLSKNAIKATVLGQTITSNSEAIAGNFSKYGVGAIDQIGGAAAAAAVNAVGSCAVFKQKLTGTSLVGAGSTVLDAGTITLNGPGVSNKTLTKTNNSYSLSLTNPLQPGQTVISPGTYILTGGGGADVAAFSAPLTISAPVTWSNIDAITVVNRAQPLTFTWTGGGGTDIVSLTVFGGTSTTVNNVTTTDATIVTCLAAASAGTFTISTSYLSQLPAVSGDLTSGQFGAASVLSVTVPPNGTLTTTPALTAGGNVDYFLFSGSSGGFKNLAIQ